MTAVRDQVAGLRSAVAAGEPAPDDLLSNLLELAWALTPLGQEAEAARFGQQAVELARATRAAATARGRFERALQLREQLGDDAAIRSTLAALGELDTRSRQRRPSSD